MNKNLIDDKKSIHVKETLFEEILNGFSELKEKQDKKSIKLDTVQRKRLVNVAQAFLNNQATNIFTKEWIGRLSGTTHEEKLLQFILQDDEEDEDEFEADDKQDKKIFESFNPLSAYRLFSMMNTLYGAYKTYNAIKNVIQGYQAINIAIDNRGMLDKNTKIIQQVKVIEDMYTMTLEPIVKSGGRSLVRYIETNKHINTMFDKVDELIREEAEGMLISLGVDAALYLVPHVGVGKTILTILKVAEWMWRMFKWGNLVGNAATFYNYYKNGLSGVTIDAESATSIAETIHTNITQPYFIPQYMEFERKIDNFLEGIDNALDVSYLIEDKREQLDADVIQLRRMTGFVRKRSDSSEVKTSSPTITFNRTFNVRTQTYDMSTSLKGLGNSIISSMFDAHAIRYNFRVNDVSFMALFHETNGLHVLRKLNELKIGISPIVYNFYNNFYRFIDTVRDELKKKIDINSVNIQNEVVPPVVNSQETSGETISGVAVEELMSMPTSSQPQTPPPPPVERGILRLSERSLQPIHPIFVNNAMIGLELDLIDSNNNALTIKIPNWNNPGNKITIAQQSSLGKINNYLTFNANYDCIKDDYMELLEEEKNYDKNLQELLEALITAIGQNYYNEILRQYE